MVDVFVDMPGATAGRGRAARHAAPGAAALGGPRRRVRLLDLEPGPGDGHRALPRRPGRGAGARPAQPEARGERRSHPAGRLGARSSSRGRSTTCRSWRVTLWCARYGDDQLRLLAGAGARRRQGGAGRLGGDAHRRTAARQVTVELDPARLAACGLDPLARAARHRRRNVAPARRPTIVSGGRDHGRSRRARWLAASSDVGDVVVAVARRAPGARCATSPTVARRRRRAGRPTCASTSRAGGGRTRP